MKKEERGWFDVEAKEMFEKLGYENCVQSEVKIVYQNKNKTRENTYISSLDKVENNGALPKKIIFWKDFEWIDFEYGRLGSYLYLELLQAINKQAEELGWFNE